MNKDLITTYLIKKMTWANKETTPIVYVSAFEYSDDRLKVKVVYDVFFKNPKSDKLYNYLNSITCTIFTSDITDFIRDKNLNELIYE